MSGEFTFRECFTEFLGILCIVYFGGWSVILYTTDKIFVTDVAFIHAFIYGVMIWCGSTHSKCQFNPAITVSAFLIGQMDKLNALYNIISQFLGCYMGALMIYYTVPEILYVSAKEAGAEIGCPHLNDKYNWIQGLVLELLVSFVLAFVYFQLSNQEGSTSAFPLGFCLGFAILCIGNITGGSVNPFRYLGPALLSLNLYDAHVYIIGPMIGAIIAGYLYKNVFAENKLSKVQPLPQENPV